MSKVWKYHYQLQPLLRWAKKFGELWSTNNRVKVAHIDQPNWTFFGRLHFGPQGVLRPEIFTHARDWSKQPSAHPNWDRGPQKNVNREKLKFRLKFSVWATITPDLVGVSSWNFFQSTAAVITRVQFSESPPPKICEGEKKRSKFGTMFDNFRLSSRISSERTIMSKVEKYHHQLQPLPRWDKKILWTLVHKQQS